MVASQSPGCRISCCHPHTPGGPSTIPVPVVRPEDLRFVHRIMTTRPNTASWPGVDTIVFDFAALVAKRMRKAPVEFWKPGKSDELRRAQWVYVSDWTESSNAEGMAS